MFYAQKTIFLLRLVLQNIIKPQNKMRLLLLHQADHLAAVALSGLQKIENLTTTAAEDLPAAAILAANFDAVLWLAGAVPIEEASPAAEQLARFSGKVLAVGAAHFALAKYYGTVISQTNDVRRQAALLQTNNNDNLLHHLPRQEMINLLLPQFSIQQLPNTLSPLAKSPEGIILAWKHRNSPKQGLCFHPFSKQWQPQGTTLVSTWLNI